MLFIGILFFLDLSSLHCNISLSFCSFLYDGVCFQTINLSLDDILFLLKTKNERLTLQNKEHLKQLLTNKIFKKNVKSKINFKFSKKLKSKLNKVLNSRFSGYINVSYSATQHMEVICFKVCAGILDLDFVFKTLHF